MKTKFNNFINEIFNSENIYDIKTDEEKKYKDSSHYRYSFITKDNIKYRILLGIVNGVGTIDFDTVGLSDNKYNSIIHLINSHDSIKVFNTIKSLIFRHNAIEKIKLSSTPDRITFYKKMLDYMKIKNKIVSDDTLIGYIK